MLLDGKKALVCGVANNRSIAYGIAKAFSDHGARLALSYAGEAFQKRVEPLSQELGSEFLLPLDVTDDNQIQKAKETVANNWNGLDVLVHAIAFAPREDLQGRFVDTSRSGFTTAMNVSVYSLVALCQAFEPLLNPEASIITMTYYGSQKVVTSYNVMGVAKAALEASLRYLATDLGKKQVRINAISAGPIRTMAASGISGFKSILKHIEARSPLQRNVDQENVGNAAVYLASDLSQGTTGDIHYVDSGYNILGI